jgi:hypothetical protein
MATLFSQELNSLSLVPINGYWGENPFIDFIFEASFTEKIAQEFATFGVYHYCHRR